MRVGKNLVRRLYSKSDGSGLGLEGSGDSRVARELVGGLHGVESVVLENAAKQWRQQKCNQTWTERILRSAARRSTIEGKDERTRRQSLRSVLVALRPIRDLRRADRGRGRGEKRQRMRSGEEE